MSIRGILRGFGLKVGPVTRKGFDARIRELVTGQATLERIAGAMLSARVALKAEYEKLHKTVLTIVREAAGALFGLTPRKYQSGEKDVTSGITRAGVRTALY